MTTAVIIRTIFLRLSIFSPLYCLKYNISEDRINNYTQILPITQYFFYSKVIQININSAKNSIKFIKKNGIPISMFLKPLYVNSKDVNIMF